MIQPIPDLDYNPIFDTDSYKLGHFRSYPNGLTSLFGHFLARGGRFQESTIAGMQLFLHRYMSKPVTLSHINEMARFAPDHGLPFNEDGWRDILINHDGMLPVRIRCIPEGLVVPTGNALYTVESTAPKHAWLQTYVETKLARLWYPSTVAIASRESKKVIKRFLDATSDDPDGEIEFKLHDFGARGVTCYEQSEIGGAAHLFNFQGSDTLAGIRAANHYYHSDMAGFSLPATEHSVMTALGRAGEMHVAMDFIQKELVLRQLPPGVPKLAACVADAYDVYEFTRQVSSGDFKKYIKASGGTFVLRPDSGDPLVVLPKIFDILRNNFKDECYVNKKGFMCLPNYFRVIQGDGINIDSMEDILALLSRLGWSASNIAFGSGGGLLQQWTRDTQKWKLACSGATIDGVRRGICKDPVTDSGKRSMSGRVDLVDEGCDEICDDETYEPIYRTALVPDRLSQCFSNSVLHTVYENGEILVDTTLDECRQRMSIS